MMTGEAEPHLPHPTAPPCTQLSKLLSIVQISLKWSNFFLRVVLLVSLDSWSDLTLAKFIKLIYAAETKALSPIVLFLMELDALLTIYNNFPVPIVI